MEELGYIKRMRVEGFKSIKKMDLSLSPLNVLIGANGAGKSNFISLFQFLNKVQSKQLQLYVQQKGTSEALLHFGSKETPEIKIIISFAINSYKAVLVPTQDGRLIFKEELAGFFPKDSGYKGGDKTIILQASDESGLPDHKKSTIGGYVSEYLSGLKIYHFHDTGETAKVKKVCNLHDNLQLKPDGENLAAFLYLISIRHNKKYQKIIQTIQRIAPFFHDFILQPEKTDNGEMIRLRWRHSNSDGYFDANSLSDGTLRFICLTTLLLQPELPKVILLDEPELGLHPYAMQLLGGMLKSASAQAQIIISTQSVTLANQFGWEDIVVVEQNNGETIFKRLKEEEIKNWLDDYKMGDLWEKNLIGGAP